MEQDYEFYDDYNFDEDPHPDKNLLQTLDKTSTPGFSIGLIACGLLLLTAIAGTVIGWILYKRISHPYLMYCAILMSITLLMACFFTFVFWKNQKKEKYVKLHVQGDFLYYVTFGLLIILGVLLLVTGLFLIIHKPFEYSYQQMDNIDQQGQSSLDEFQQDWSVNRSLNQWLTFTFFLAAFLCLLAALNLFSNLIDKSDESQLVIYIGLFLAFLFGFLALTQFYSIKNVDKNMGGASDMISYSDFKVIFYLIIALLIISFIALILSQLSSKTFSLLMGIILLFTGIIGCIKIANDIRVLKKAINENFHDQGRKILTKLPQDEVSFCDKYSQNGKLCNYQDTSRNWETNNSPSILNRNCFSEASNWYYSKYFRFLLFSFLSFGFLLVASVGFFLYSEYNHEELSKNMIGRITLGLILLMSTFFILFLIFSYNSSYDKSYQSFQTQQNQKFQKVPADKIPKQETTVNCSNFKDMEIFYWNQNKSDYVRVAILGKNLSLGNIKPTFIQTIRTLFFNDKNLSDNDFAFFKGKVEDVEQSMNLMEVCLKDVQQDMQIYIKYEKVNESDINSVGLKQSETLDSNLQEDSNVNFNANWSYNQNLQCQSKCHTQYKFKKQSDLVQIKGVLKVVDQSGNYVNFQSNLAHIEMSLKHDDGTEETIPYDSNGNFEIEVYAFPGIEKNYIIQTRDGQNYYLPNEEVVTLPQRQNLSGNFNIGAINLITKDGKGCQGSSNYSNCIASAIHKKGRIKLDVGREVQNLKIQLKKYQNNEFQVVKEANINERLTDLGEWFYGEYSIHIDDDEYFRLFQNIQLQEELHEVTLKLIEMPPDDTHRFVMVKSSKVDIGNLNLKMKSKEGTECVVNYSNQECPGVIYKEIKENDDQIMQIMDINDYQVANYMLYISPTLTLDTTCSNSLITRQPMTRRLDLKRFLILKNLLLENFNIFLFDSDNIRDKKEITMQSVPFDFFTKDYFQQTIDFIFKPIQTNFKFKKEFSDSCYGLNEIYKILNFTTNFGKTNDQQCQNQQKKLKEQLNQDCSSLHQNFDRLKEKSIKDFNSVRQNHDEKIMGNILKGLEQEKFLGCDAGWDQMNQFRGAVKDSWKLLGIVKDQKNQEQNQQQPEEQNQVKPYIPPNVMPDQQSQQKPNQQSQEQPQEQLPQQPVQQANQQPKQKQPEQQPKEQQPEQQPKQEQPEQQPKQEQPEQQTKQQQPEQQPKQQQPEQQPKEQQPEQQPIEEQPEKQSEQQPKEQYPVQQPKEQQPEQQPKEQQPEQQPEQQFKEGQPEQQPKEQQPEQQPEQQFQEGQPEQQPKQQPQQSQPQQQQPNQKPVQQTKEQQPEQKPTQQQEIPNIPFIPQKPIQVDTQNECQDIQEKLKNFQFSYLMKECEKDNQECLQIKNIINKCDLQPQLSPSCLKLSKLFQIGQIYQEIPLEEEECEEQIENLLKEDECQETRREYLKKPFFEEFFDQGDYSDCNQISENIEKYEDLVEDCLEDKQFLSTKFQVKNIIYLDCENVKNVEEKLKEGDLPGIKFQVRDPVFNKCLNLKEKFEDLDLDWKVVEKGEKLSEKCLNLREKFDGIVLDMKAKEKNYEEDNEYDRPQQIPYSRPEKIPEDQPQQRPEIPPNKPEQIPEDHPEQRPINIPPYNKQIPQDTQCDELRSQVIEVTKNPNLMKLSCQDLRNYISLLNFQPEEKSEKCLNLKEKFQKLNFKEIQIQERDEEIQKCVNLKQKMKENVGKPFKVVETDEKELGGCLNLRDKFNIEMGKVKIKEKDEGVDQEINKNDQEIPQKIQEKEDSENKPQENEEQQKEDLGNKPQENEEQEKCLKLKDKFKNQENPDIKISESDIKEFDKCINLKIKLSDLSNPDIKFVENETKNKKCLNLRQKLQNLNNEKFKILENDRDTDHIDLNKELENQNKNIQNAPCCKLPEKISPNEKCLNLKDKVQIYNQNQNEEDKIKIQQDEKCLELKDKIRQKLGDQDIKYQFTENDLQPSKCLNLKQKFQFYKEHHGLFKNVHSFNRISCSSVRKLENDVPDLEYLNEKDSECQHLKQVLKSSIGLDYEGQDEYECWEKMYDLIHTTDSNVYHQRHMRCQKMHRRLKSCRQLSEITQNNDNDYCFHQSQLVDELFDEFYYKIKKLKKKQKKKEKIKKVNQGEILRNWKGNNEEINVLMQQDKFIKEIEKKQQEEESKKEEEKKKEEEEKKEEENNKEEEKVDQEKQQQEKKGIFYEVRRLKEARKQVDELLNIYDRKPEEDKQIETNVKSVVDNFEDNNDFCFHQADNFNELFDSLLWKIHQVQKKYKFEQSGKQKVEEKQDQEKQKEEDKKNEVEEKQKEEEDKKNEEEKRKEEEEKQKEEEEKRKEEEEKKKEEEEKRKEESPKQIFYEVRRLEQIQPKKSTNFIAWKCFTGFGKVSEIFIQKVTTQEPNMSICETTMNTKYYNLDRLIKYLS